MNYATAWVGDFECTSNMIDIVDPHINSMSILEEQIPVANEMMVHVRGVLGGLYRAYHVYMDNGAICAMLVLHNGYDLEKLEFENICSFGNVSSRMGSAVVIVDKRYRHAAEYNYFPIDDDAIFDPKTFMEKIQDMPYGAAIKEKFLNMVRTMVKEGKNPRGIDIKEILAGEHIWEGFRRFEEKSSMWSVEIEKKLYNSHTGSTSIKGGVASMATPGTLECLGCRNRQGYVYGIIVQLDQSIDLRRMFVGSIECMQTS